MKCIAQFFGDRAQQITNLLGMPPRIDEYDGDIGEVITMVRGDDIFTVTSIMGTVSVTCNANVARQFIYLRPTFTCEIDNNLCGDAQLCVVTLFGVNVAATPNKIMFTTDDEETMDAIITFVLRKGGAR